MAKLKKQILSDLLKSSAFKSGKRLLDSIHWETMNSRIADALKIFLKGQEILGQAYQEHMQRSNKENHPQEMTFALDGRLVGDIGELIAAEIFCLELLGTKAKKIDAITTSEPKRNVQIKATFWGKSISLKHDSDYLIGLQLNNEGQFRVIYNGPVKPLIEYLKAPKAEGLKGRANAGKQLERFALSSWAVLNLGVSEVDRIPRRKK